MINVSEMSGKRQDLNMCEVKNIIDKNEVTGEKTAHGGIMTPTL